MSSIFSFFRKSLLQILAVVFLALLLISTWFVLQDKKSFPEEIHLAIQEEFKKVVKEKLLEKNPMAKNIQFYELWTETTDQSSQIRAVFSYSFHDPAHPEDEIDVTVKGSALINRRLDTPPEDAVEKWEIGSFDVDQTEMSFNNEVLMIAPEDVDLSKINLENSKEPANNP